MIIQGDALTELQKLQTESIDCCITSPPYWTLRDYKVNGQLGLEPTFQEYINKLVTIFDEVKRVLKKTGSCWVVIGDTYSATKNGYSNGSPSSTLSSRKQLVKVQNEMTHKRKACDSNIPEKSLCLIPERFSIAMIDHGWILRNKIIWYKPNCMPSSAKDRFTVDWEYVYFFTKSQRYFFETQYEPLEVSTKERAKHNGYLTRSHHKHKDDDPFTKQWQEFNMNPLGRIKRCVWKISTKPFSGAHFAVFPPELVKPMIKAGSPEYICNKCQTPRILNYEYTGNQIKCGHGTSWKAHGNAPVGKHSVFSTGTQKEMVNNGLSDCGCNAGFHSATVLDPFMGAGTTGLVALQNARDFIGIELNPEYIELAKKRLDPWLRQERLMLLG